MACSAKLPNGKLNEVPVNLEIDGATVTKPPGTVPLLAMTKVRIQVRSAAKAGTAYEEEKRLKWFKFYVSNASFAKAAELVVTPVEAAMLLKAKATATPGPCACCTPDPKQARWERYERFVQAIRAYEWEVADMLAITKEEAQDVTDSKMRVAAMRGALESRDYKRALEYAITDPERAKVQAAMNGGSKELV